MKTFKSFLWVIGISLITLVLPACSDDDSYSLGDMWVAIATVVPENERDYYLRLDNGDRLWPAATNYPGYHPKPNQRALVNFTILADAEHSNLGGFTHYIKVNAIHDILTKPIAPNEGVKNDSIYGTDPMQIEKDNIWIGDGFLNIFFETHWGGKTPHFMNLIQPDVANEPYTVEFRQNAYDDPKTMRSNGRIAFHLGLLPDTKGQTVNLKVRYWSYEGVKEFILKYNTDKTLLNNENAKPKNESAANMANME